MKIVNKNKKCSLVAVMVCEKKVTGIKELNYDANVNLMHSLKLNFILVSLFVCTFCLFFLDGMHFETTSKKQTMTPFFI